MKNGYYDIRGEPAEQIGNLLNVYEPYSFHSESPVHLAELRVRDAGYKLDAHAKDYFVTADIRYDGTIIFREIDCVTGNVNIVRLDENGLTIMQDQWSRKSGIADKPQVVERNPENATDMEIHLRESIETALQLALSYTKS